MAQFWCNSVSNTKIPEWGTSNFFQPKEWSKTKIRFLAWPYIYHMGQTWGDDRKPVWKKRYYAEWDKAANLDAEAKFTMAYIIYNYELKPYPSFFKLSSAYKYVVEGYKEKNNITFELDFEL